MGPELQNHHDDGYQPLALITVTLCALVGFAVFFLSFLVAPLAILIIFYVGFAASDRSKRNGSTARLAAEADQRQHVMRRADDDQAAVNAEQLARLRGSGP
jgi:hypothetical protein